MFKTYSLYGAWLVAVFFAFVAINDYSTTSGANTTGSRMPASAQYRPGDKPRLLVFLHPKCGCSVATLSELNSLLPELAGIDVTVLFRDSAGGKDWLKGELFESAQKMKGITVALDPEGAEAKLFGAHASGHTVLVTPGQQIVFSGGLTPSRGHTGESSGKHFLRQWNKDRKPASFVSAIFGCNLFKEMK